MLGSAAILLAKAIILKRHAPGVQTFEAKFTWSATNLPAGVADGTLPLKLSDYLRNSPGLLPRAVRVPEPARLVL